MALIPEPKVITFSRKEFSLYLLYSLWFSENVYDKLIPFLLHSTLRTSMHFHVEASESNISENCLPADVLLLVDQFHPK